MHSVTQDDPTAYNKHLTRSQMHERCENRAPFDVRDYVVRAFA